jgi:hypothetical protein
MGDSVNAYIGKQYEDISSCFLQQMPTEPSCFSETLAILWVSTITAVIPSIKAETTAIQAQDDLQSVLLQLRANDADLEKEVATLSAQLAVKKRDLVAKMKVGMTKPAKSKAFAQMMPSIRKIKSLETQQKMNGNRINLVVKQLEAFENGKFQQSIVKTLKQSVMAMKQIGIGNKADEIDVIMGDLDESLMGVEEVNQVLSGANLNSMNLDDDELLSEFDAWLEEEDDDEQVKGDNSIVAGFPSMTKVADKALVSPVRPVYASTAPSVINQIPATEAIPAQQEEEDHSKDVRPEELQA